ncbi:MAG: hypothetical protein QXV73_04445 [Candidatus Micrarchaeia archaeon]
MKDRLYNIFQELEQREKKAVLISFVLAICLCVVVVSFVFYVSSPKPIYYINGVSGIATPLVDYAPIAEEYAKLFVSNITNFKSENVKDVFENAKKMCSESYLAKIRPILNSEITSAEKSKINSSSSIMSSETKKITEDTYKVNVKIFRVIWIGQEKVSEKIYYYNVLVKKVSPRVSNPIGMVVDNVEITESNI